MKFFISTLVGIIKVKVTLVSFTEGRTQPEGFPEWGIEEDIRS